MRGWYLEQRCELVREPASRYLREEKFTRKENRAKNLPSVFEVDKAARCKVKKARLEVVKRFYSFL